MILKQLMINIFKSNLLLITLKIQDFAKVVTKLKVSIVMSLLGVCFFEKLPFLRKRQNQCFSEVPQLKALEMQIQGYFSFLQYMQYFRSYCKNFS